jgi:alginate O-acetyltransferase complex protein AlgI
LVFSSISFLFWFLPFTLALYHFAPRQARNAILLGASLAFYTWGGGAAVLLLVVSVLADFVCGAWAHRSRLRGNARGVRLAIAGSVVTNLLLLGYFKYANFAVAQFNAAADTLGLGVIAWESVALPIGISFFTFQSMTYTFDVARGRVEPTRSLFHFALYVTLFPQLIAGPIVRYLDIADQIHDRDRRLEDLSSGVLRFSHGLVKKVIVADSVGMIADAVFAAPGDGLSASLAWLGVGAYTLQIYFDFSGYSDMAIGLGRMFGFRFPENFLRPYSATSITDFWRRWHVTLSRWFRDYVYIPWGGSQKGAAATYRNLIVVFLLCGLWHGANWTFVVWGAWHGLLLVLERVSGQRNASLAPGVRRALTLFLVILGWVVFRADSMDHAMQIYSAMLGMGSGEAWPAIATALTHRNLLVAVIASSVVLLPGDFSGPRLIETGCVRSPRLARAALMFVLLPWALLLAAAGTYSPFLYYQF